jgi:hypothetical protein
MQMVFRTAAVVALLILLLGLAGVATGWALFT